MFRWTKHVVFLSTLLSSAAGIAHPVSYVDAWAKVEEDGVDVRLNVFLDEVLRRENLLPADGTRVDSETIRDAIRRHTTELPKLLTLRDASGQLLNMSVISSPAWESDNRQINLANDVSLKVSWSVRFNRSSSTSENRALCFLHHFVSGDDNNQGELRLHLQHRTSGKRIDTVIASDRPHTIVLPDPSRETGNANASMLANAAIARIVIGSTGVVTEFSAPLLLWDAALPASLKRKDDGQFPSECSASDIAAVKKNATRWARQAMSLSVNGRQVEWADVVAEILPSDGDNDSERQINDSDADVSLFGTRLGVRLLSHPRQSVDSTELLINKLPGPFAECVVEVVSHEGQLSELVTLEDSTGTNELAGLHHVWSRRASEVPVAVVDETISPIRFFERRPGSLALLVSLLVSLTGLIGVTKIRSWQTRIAIGAVWISGVALAIWLLPQKHAVVDTVKARELALQTLNTIYQSVARDHENVAVERLSQVLHADLAEQTYLDHVAMFTSETDVKSPLLIDIQSVDIVALGDSTCATDHLQTSCTWEVRGTVHHWGHSHTRSASVTGNLEFTPINGQWKCQQVRMTSPMKFDVELSSSNSKS